MAQEEFDQIQEDFDTKSYDQYSPIQQQEINLNSTQEETNESHEAEVITETSSEVATEEAHVNESPDEELEGNVDENGYEWLEYPENSGINFYRIKGESNQWVEWTTSENSS